MKTLDFYQTIFRNDDQTMTIVTIFRSGVFKLY